MVDFANLLKQKKVQEEISKNLITALNYILKSPENDGFIGGVNTLITREIAVTCVLFLENKSIQVYIAIVFFY